MKISIWVEIVTRALSPLPSTELVSVKLHVDDLDEDPYDACDCADLCTMRKAPSAHICMNRLTRAEGKKGGG